MTDIKPAEGALGGVLGVALIFGIGQQFAGGVGVTCARVRTCVGTGAADVFTWVPVGAAVLVGLVAMGLVISSATPAANTDKTEGES